MEALSWSAKLYWTLVSCWQVLYKVAHTHLCLLTSFHTDETEQSNIMTQVKDDLPKQSHIFIHVTYARQVHLLQS